MSVFVPDVGRAGAEPVCADVNWKLMYGVLILQWDNLI